MIVLSTARWSWQADGAADSSELDLDDTKGKTIFDRRVAILAEFEGGVRNMSKSDRKQLWACTAAGVRRRAGDAARESSRSATWCPHTALFASALDPHPQRGMLCRG